MGIDSSALRMGGLWLVAVLACAVAPTHTLAADEPLTTQEIRYRVSGAEEVRLTWGVNGWQPLPEALRPPGTTMKDGLMQTPMRQAADGFVTEVRAPSGARLDFGFLVTRLSNGATAAIWDGRGTRDDDYHARAGQTDPIVIEASSFVQRKVEALLRRSPLTIQRSPSDMRPAHPPILAWFLEELRNYRMALVLLAALALFSGPTRRAVSGGRFGATVSGRRLPPAIIWIIALLPAGFWLWNVWLSLTREALFLETVAEDGWMEYGQVLLLFFSSVISGLIARSFWKRRQRFWALGYLFLALASFWTAGEEISWGQRLLHLATPAWFQSHNMQQEMNLHNLSGLDEGLSNLTDTVLAGAVLVSAAVWMTGFNRVRRLRAALWVPHPSLIPALCCVISYGDVFRLYELLHPNAKEFPEAVVQLQEPRELVLYFILFIFLLCVRSWHRSGFGGAAELPKPRRP